MSTVDRLWQGIQAGRIDETFPETDVDDGQRMQLQLLDKWRDQGEELGGYKIGLTSGAARNIFGVGIRPFGYVLKSRIFRSGDAVTLSDIGKMGVENELVFRVARDIKTDSATREDALSVLDGVAPGFEINQLRLTSAQSPGIRLAENLSQWGTMWPLFSLWRLSHRHHRPLSYRFLSRAVTFISQVNSDVCHISHQRAGCPVLQPRSRYLV